MASLLRVWSCLLTLGVLLPGCGEIPPSTPPAGGWTREFVPLTVPWARDTASIRDEASSLYVPSRLPEVQLVINLLADGELYVWGEAYELAPGPAREQHLAAFGEALERSAAWRPTGPDGHELHVNADRQARWGALYRVLAAAEASSNPFDVLTVAVRSPLRPGWRRVAFDLYPYRAPTSAHVLRVEADPDAGTARGLRIAGGGGAWRPLAPVPARPTAAWDSALPEPLPEGTADVTIEATDDVPWEQVVRVLDACRAAGVAHVHLPAAGVTLDPRAHPRDPPGEPTPDAPLGPWGAAALALLCLAAAWLAWRARRPVSSARASRGA